MRRGQEHLTARMAQHLEKPPVATPVENGSIVPYKSGGYLVVHEKEFGDFILKCDVRWEDTRCNSGVFFRVEDLKNPVHTGFEIQVMGGEKTGKHEFGAIYDIASTTKNTGKPAGEWNTLEIACRLQPISWKGSSWSMTSVWAA